MSQITKNGLKTKNGMTVHSSSKKSAPFKLFGFDLSILSPKICLSILSFGHVLFSVCFALLQEKVYRIPGFKYGGFMTTVTCLTYVICALIELLLTGGIKPKGTFSDYLKLAASTYFGMYFTNWSLLYISYPVRVIFKSSKLLPVMFVAIFFLGKKFSLKQILSNIFLVIAVFFFILGDSNNGQNKNSSIFGIILITIGVLFDAITSNFEEHRFFRTRKSSHAEVMLYTNLVSLFYSIFVSFSTGEMSEAISYLHSHTEVLVLTVMFSFVNYFSVSFILLTISRFGSTQAEVIKSVRKVMSILLSFMMFSKPVNVLHVLGGVLFSVSVFGGVFAKFSKSDKSLKVRRLSDSVEDLKEGFSKTKVRS